MRKTLFPAFVPLPRTVHDAFDVRVLRVPAQHAANFSELATNTAGSPERRGASTAGILSPVTLRATSMTSHTESVATSQVANQLRVLVQFIQREQVRRRQIVNTR